MEAFRRWLVTCGIAAVLLFFSVFPLAILLYGGAGGAIGGALILGAIILVQYPLLLLFRRLLPAPERPEDEVGPRA